MPYTVFEYGKMINDKYRMDLYYSALSKCITPDSVVVDLGAGTGIFSLMACSLGAKKVYAIEPNPAINLGVQSAKKNGWEEKIIFLQESSTDVDLPEKADILVSDIRGMLPLYGNNLEVIRDARKRFLKPNGCLIPGKDTIMCSVVSTKNLYSNITSVWDKGIQKIDLSDGLLPSVNGIYPPGKSKYDLISSTGKWIEIDYYSFSKSNFKNKFTLSSEKQCTAHGLLLWFNSILSGDIDLKNSPEIKGSDVYGRAFFPFSEPVKLEKGTRVDIEISAKLSSDRYIWAWKTKFFKKFSRTPYTSFTQSTFLNTPVSPGEFIKKSPAYRPKLNKRGLIELEVLKMFEKKKSNEQVAEKLKKDYPGEFKSIDDTLHFVGLMAAKYSS